MDMLAEKKLINGIVVDCSHSNSRKQYGEQSVVWNDVLHQRISGNDAIIGMMLESNLNEGQQKNTGDLNTMKYGVSITDACISWETTEGLILDAGSQLRNT
jgi:3-deoxy-7-phosphoheptulonate synthase